MKRRRCSICCLFSRIRRAVVVKTIRADEGAGVEDGDADGTRVIHLVRDPRAVVHSQIKTFNVAHKYRRYFHGPSPQAETAKGTAETTPGLEANVTQV